MKRFIAIMLIFIFLLPGCSFFSPAKNTDKNPTDTEQTDTINPDNQNTEDVIENTDIATSTEEDTMQNGEQGEVPSEDIANLEDDAKLKEEEKKEEEKKAKEAEKKPMPYRVQVDVTNQVVTVFSRDNAGKYSKVAHQMIASTGAPSTPTPLGKFVLPGDKGRWGYFKDFDVYAQYWMRLKGGILFHSVLFKKPDESTISRTSVRNLGRPVSHGCIRLTVSDAKWLYQHVGAGTEVIVTKGKRNGALVQKLKSNVPGNKVVQLTLNPAQIPQLEVNNSQKLSLQAKYDDGRVANITSGITWAVDNAKVATVNSGTVKGLNPGSANITATFGGKSVNAQITVNAPKIQPTLILSPNTITIEEGQSKTLKALYNDGQETDVTTKAQWSATSETGSIQVNNGKITAVKAGSGEVIVKYNGLTAKAKVSVKEAPKKEPKLQSINIIVPNKQINAKVGDTISIDAKIQAVYDNGETKNVSGEIQLASSSPNAVKIENGKAVAVGAGDADITVKGIYNNISSKIETVKITVTAPETPSDGEKTAQ